MSSRPYAFVFGFALWAAVLLDACSNDKPITHYYCSLIKTQDSYILDYRFVTSRGLSISDGVVKNYDAGKVFVGYDTSIIALKGNIVLPKRIGTTQIFLSHQFPDSIAIVDTVQVIVEQVSGVLTIRQ